MNEPREQMDRWLKQIEHEAYARGWAAAMAAIRAATLTPSDSSPTTLGEAEASAPGATTIQEKSSRGRGRPAKAITIVEEIIASGQGMKGVEIVAESERLGTPILERTVRSCLARLRARKVIWQRRGKWYVKDKAGQDQLPLAEQFNEEAVSAPPH